LIEGILVWVLVVVAVRLVLRGLVGYMEFHLKHAAFMDRLVHTTMGTIMVLTAISAIRIGLAAHR